MSKINFTKITGAGNDFILIDKELNRGLVLTSKIIEEICDRRYGVGADGLLTIDDSANSDFEMEYFNSDGSSGMLCGNGARSIIRYAEYSGRLNKAETQFYFQNELFSGKVLDSGKIKFNLNTPTKIKRNFKIEILDKKLNVSFIDTGAHHVVVNLDEENNNIASLEKYQIVEFGKAIRYSKYFEPLGTNVNFISIKNSIINIRTYERGVEEETLACGTGAVASAIISFLDKKVSPPVTLITKSNETLIVDFKYSQDQFENISLTGMAKIVFEGKYITKG